MKLKVVVDRDLLPLNQQQTILRDEFERYKRVSLSRAAKNFITPSVGDQMAMPSDHPSFGRDTEFERPESLITDIHKYRLTKVHVDTRSAWTLHKKQWYCTSNESIVYSGFISSDGTYIFVIIEFLISANAASPDDFDAHKSYTTEDVDQFLDIAAENQDDFLADQASEE
ncbi:type II toxin-antitoxin system YafO family toxin [Vibrio fluvialis]|nr:type II toxin-antitoxin system YafO family toxin [Vibrio fluvialis]MBY7898736.1 type II toxin-antitoxin system YafO family toxin [Vibrio fluvialis]MBY7922054.1 type II toxin-antitoxin system YafO family toxin [Vibrio fluvialis]MBY7977890.1 type II toxin-antitoxin system YafO family toxin [Vibrio fluvialis]MBY8259583.1 type II toxin-antitoxin system YafO family toxin [Vibrio fluvialis]